MTESARSLSAERAFAGLEHRDLRPGIDRVHEVGRWVGTIAAPDLSLVLLDVLDWFERVVEPHIAWEEAWLYPELDRLAGTAWATKAERYEHHHIRHVAARLEADRDRLRHEPSHDQTAELLADLFGLEALLRAHIEREERFLLPLLDEAPIDWLEPAPTTA
ncbi:MAG: hemerythrin domain-containing protein [Chloroflexota bacterium]